MSNPAASQIVDLTVVVNNLVVAAPVVDDDDDAFIIDDDLAAEMCGPPGIVYGHGAGAWPHCEQCKLRRNVWSCVRDLVGTIDEELDFFFEFDQDPVEVERAMDSYELSTLNERSFLRKAVTDVYNVIDALETQLRHNGVLVESTANIRKAYQSMARALPMMSSLATKRELYHGSLEGELKALRSKLLDLENRPGPCSVHDDERIYKANIVLIIATHTSALPPDMQVEVKKGVAWLSDAIKLLKGVVAAEGPCQHIFQ